MKNELKIPLNTDQQEAETAYKKIKVTGGDNISLDIYIISAMKKFTDADFMGTPGVIGKIVEQICSMDYDGLSREEREDLYLRGLLDDPFEDDDDDDDSRAYDVGRYKQVERRLKRLSDFFVEKDNTKLIQPLVREVIGGEICKGSGTPIRYYFRSSEDERDARTTDRRSQYREEAVDRVYAKAEEFIQNPDFSSKKRLNAGSYPFKN